MSSDPSDWLSPYSRNIHASPLKTESLYSYGLGEFEDIIASFNTNTELVNFYRKVKMQLNNAKKKLHTEYDNDALRHGISTVELILIRTRDYCHARGCVEP